MTKSLFNRDAVLTVGGVRISAQDPKTQKPQPMLRFTFNITKTTDPTPNTAEIAVYNLSASNRGLLTKKNVPVVLTAGYRGNTSVIFSGELHTSFSTQQGTDWVTVFQSSDGGEKFKSARINVGLKGPVTLKQAIKAAADALGVKPGNIDTKNPVRSIKEFVQGIVLSGKAEKQLAKLIRSAGFEWSIQDGALQVIAPDEFVDGPEQLSLEVGTGLIGSPEAGEDGVVKVKALLQPGLSPGRRIRVISRQISGFFKIEKNVTTGDTWGDAWHADLELRPL